MCCNWVNIHLCLVQLVDGRSKENRKETILSCYKVTALSVLLFLDVKCGIDKKRVDFDKSRIHATEMKVL